VTSPRGAGAAATSFTIAANRGELGGGEVMLLQIAQGARSLGLSVTVVAPATPGETTDASRSAGLATLAVSGVDRRSYLRHLRAWDRRHRQGLLWCNGLAPALATAGHGDRVVHLHQEPAGPLVAANRVARAGCRATVVPSASMGRRVDHDMVLPNWTSDLSALPTRPATGPVTIGYLGRLQLDKGVHLLGPALGRLRAEGLDVDLVLAGDEGFGARGDTAVVEASLAPVSGHVRRLGRVPRDQFFAEVDLAVFPSVWPEPFGLVVAEAMAFGVPFVVSDAGALTEVAGPGHAWTATAGDEVDLARVISAALHMSPEARAAQVANARLRWEEQFSPAAGVARLATVLANLGLAVDRP
jgi:glycosyltransferase involved in cell wall biosynthesis